MSAGNQGGPPPSSDGSGLNASVFSQTQSSVGSTTTTPPAQQGVAFTGTPSSGTAYPANALPFVHSGLPAQWQPPSIQGQAAATASPPTTLNVAQPEGEESVVLTQQLHGPTRPKPQTRLQSLAFSKIEDALGASMRLAVTGGSHLPDDAMRTITELLGAHGMQPGDIDQIEAAVKTMQEHTAVAIATQVTNEARQRLEPALLSHNSDLARAQSAIENLEEEANSAEQTIVRTRLDLVLREQHQKARHDTLESECEHLRKEQRIRDLAGATNLDPYSTQRGAMHEVLTLLDRLFCTRHRSVLAERHVLELRSQSNQKRSLIDVGGGDITRLTLEDLSLMSKSSTEADDISKIHTDLGKSIQATDASIRGVLTQYYGIPALGRMREADLLSKMQQWKAILAECMDSTPSTERGIKMCGAILTLLMATPTQSSVLLPLWQRVHDEYAHLTRPSKWELPSCWKLVRAKGVAPVWVKDKLPTMDEAGYEYSEELCDQYQKQNGVLYQLLLRAHPEACELAAEGCSFGQISKDRPTYRGHKMHGLQVLHYYIMKLSQRTEGAITMLLDSMDDAYMILAKKGDTIELLREWRKVIQHGIRHRLKVKWTQCCYRAAMILHSKHPQTLGETLKPYIEGCAPEYEDSALTLCMTMSNDCEGQLAAYASIMAPSKAHHPHIRARMATSTPMGRAGQRTCMESRCSKPILSDLAARCDGANTRFRCPDCHTKHNANRTTSQPQPQRARFVSHTGGHNTLYGGGRSFGGQRGSRPAGRGGRGNARGRSSGRGGRGGGRGGANRSTGGSNSSSWRSSMATGAARPAAARGFKPRFARAARLERDSDQSERSGYLRDESSYMLRVIRGDENMSTSLLKNITEPFEDSRHAKGCSNPQSACRDVRCARAAQGLLNESCCFLSLCLDTGATHSVIDACVEPFLMGAKKSDARVSGFSSRAPAVRASLKGTINTYIMNPQDPAIPRAHDYQTENGQFVQLAIDTMPSLSDSLMSFSSLFSTAGYSLRLVNDDVTGTRSCCIERKNRFSGDQETIPLNWDATRRAFVAYVCVGKTEAIAMQAGRAAERTMQALSRKLGRTSTLIDLGVEGGVKETPFNIKIAQLQDTVAVLERALPNNVLINTVVNGARVVGKPNDKTMDRMGFNPKFDFEGEGKGAPEDGDADDDVRHSLRACAHDTESYGFSGGDAVHPRARQRVTQVTSRLALLHPAGPLGWECVSGAFELEEDGHNPYSAETESPLAPTPGESRGEPITLSSSESGGAPDASTPACTARRRRLSMAPGLQRGLELHLEHGRETIGGGGLHGEGGAVSGAARKSTPTPTRDRGRLKRCPTVGGRKRPINTSSLYDTKEDKQCRVCGDYESEDACHGEYCMHEKRLNLARPKSARGAPMQGADLVHQAGAVPEGEATASARVHQHSAREVRRDPRPVGETFDADAAGPDDGPVGRHRVRALSHDPADVQALTATQRGVRLQQGTGSLSASAVDPALHRPTSTRRGGERAVNAAAATRASTRAARGSSAHSFSTAGAVRGSAAGSDADSEGEGDSLTHRGPGRDQASLRQSARRRGTLHAQDGVGPISNPAAASDPDSRSISGSVRTAPENRDHDSDLTPVQIEFLSDFDSAGISGVRRTMASREAKSSIADLHRRYGHMGSQLDGQTCSLCAMAGGKFLRHAVSKSRAPHAPELPGFAFTADIVFMRDTPAFCGAQYALVMRCLASGYYVCAYGKTKNFGAKIIEIITGMRAKSYFSMFPYKIFSEIKSDMDGSWAFEKDTAEQLKKLGVTLKLNSPSSTDDHRTNAAAEAAVRFVVHTTKMILYENRLPTAFWKIAMEQAVMLRNLFPIHKFASTVHSGDAVRPLEQMSRYQISRSDCNQLLHALIPIGALCLVHQAQLRGSNIDTPTCRWGIAAGMVGKTSSFFCPFAGPKSARWYSRNYVQLKLPAGMGYHAALNIAQEPGTGAPDRLTVPPADADIHLKNIITIPNLSSLTAARRKVWTPVVSLKTGPLHEGGTPSIVMTDAEGWVYAHTETGRIVRTSQKLTLEQKAQPNIGLLDHLKASGITMGGALDAQRRFDPGLLIGNPRQLIGKVFWKRFDTGLYLGTVRLYDPQSRLWTVTFRDGTHEDYDLREMQLYFAERIHDPGPDVDWTTDHGTDLQCKANEGPDTDELPLALMEELCHDMGHNVIAPLTGRRIDWETATAAEIQSALDDPKRSQAKGDDLAQPEPEMRRRQQRRKQDSPRKWAKGRTGRTAGVNPAARTDRDQEAKRQRTARPQERAAGAPPDGADDDGLPWADRLFNWKGHNLPIPTHGVPPTVDQHFEISFSEWDDYGLPSITAPRGGAFNAVCIKLGLDVSESKLYYAWLGPAFGARGVNCTGTGGARFHYPWGRGSQQTLLDGQRFPIPSGRLWEKLKEQTRMKQNAGNTEHANIRVARAVLGSVITNEKCHDSVTRATVDKTALREAYTYATEHCVHEQDRTEAGSKLRALMARIGHGARRITPTLMTLGILASSQVHNWEPQIVDPYSTKTILTRQDIAWRDGSQTHLHINANGLIDVTVGKGADQPHDIVLCKAQKQKSKENSVKRGEPIINPRTGRVMAPRTVRDIEGRPDAKIWLEAIEVELAALESMKVLIHDLTYDQIRAMGISSSFVPLNIVLTCKWTPLGTFDRAKARCCVVGSPHFMKKGIHYGNTFAPTPSFEVTRLLMALCCAKGYARFQWDIKNAFASVPIANHERVALRYPKGAERFDKNGRPLFAVMDRALYGVPSSSRKFIKHLQTFILKRFNTGGFKAHNTRSDPCLYVLRNPRGRQIYLSAWCDDVQCVGANIKDLEEVCAMFKETFELKICDVQELLGVRREISQDGKTTFMNLTQPGFIVNTCDEHRGACEQLFKKPRDTPYPPKEMLSRSEIPEDEHEAKRMHEANIKRGYMSMTGSILWAARQCLPELSYGASQLCRLMSTPTDKAYEHALHMLSYMDSQKDRGIRYSSDGNRQVLACYDSSFKPDPKDSKCQYGYCIYFMNAPIAWCSRKHDHIALSSSHAEYMALAHTARTVVWIRNLFKEMNLGEFVDGPTICLGDNINANMLAKEGKVSTQNRHILLAYHYAKEAYETGEICPRRVCTRDNPSDVLTKANPKPDIARLVPNLTGWGGTTPIPPALERE